MGLSFHFIGDYFTRTGHSLPTTIERVRIAHDGELQVGRSPGLGIADAVSPELSFDVFTA